MRGRSSFANRLFALFIFLLVLGGYLGFYLIPTLTQGERDSITPFSENGSGGNSCSKLVTALKASGPSYSFYSILGSPLALKDIADPSRSAYLAIDIERDYRKSERIALTDFNENGGSIIFADDGVKANELSRDITGYDFGSEVVTKPYVPNETSKEPIMVNATLGQQKYLLALDQPVRLSPWFWLTPDDPHLGAVAWRDIYDFAILREWSGSQGPVFLISDPHIFTNRMFDKGGNGTIGNNGRFLVDLIHRMLPTGGKLFFDESRHVGTPFVSIGQGSLEALIILTSNWNENGLMFLGLAMVLIAVISRTKGKEEWAHKHNPNRRAVRGYLPETGRDARILLRESLLKKVRTAKRLSEEELDEMPRDELVALVNDKELTRLLDDEGKDLSKEDIRRIMKRIERWG